MKSKRMTVWFVLSAAAAASIIAEAQSLNPRTVPSSAPPAVSPRKSGEVRAPSQHPPIDDASGRGITANGSTTGSGAAGISMPIQPLPPEGNKPLPKPY